MKKIIAIILTLLLTFGSGTGECLAQSKISSLFDLFTEGFETKLGQWTYATPASERSKFMIVSRDENSFEAMVMIDGCYIPFGAAINDQWKTGNKYLNAEIIELLDAQPLRDLYGRSVRIVGLSGMDDDEEIAYLGTWIGGHRVTAYQRQSSENVPVEPYAFAYNIIVQLLDQANHESIEAFDFELLANEYIPEEPHQASANLITFENGVFGIAGRSFDCRTMQTAASVSDMLQHVAKATGHTVYYSEQAFTAS